MKSLREFAENVLEGIHEKAGMEFQVSITESLKNNGIRLTGISAMPAGSSVKPCVYLDGYYREYENGNISFPETVEKVCSQIINHKNDFCDVDITDFLDWDIVRDHIYVKLVNAGRNKEMLKMVPHRMFLDLAAVYYLTAGGMTGDPCISTILIHNQHMPLWGQDEEKLYEAAVYNMHSGGAPVFEDIGNFLNHLVWNPEDTAGSRGITTDIGMYVLTNRCKYYGASEILDKNILKEISDKMGGGFIVLPSSVHDVIILAENNWMEYRELASIVREVNAAEVSAEDYLSDHVYVYGRNDGILKIAA